MRRPSIPLHEGQKQFGSQKHLVKIASSCRVKEFPGESWFGRWLRRARQLADVPISAGDYALYVGRRRIYGIALAIVTITVLFAFLPHLRFLVWPGIAWALLVVSAMVVLGVIVNILVVVLSMYIGYRPAHEPWDQTASATTSVPTELLPFEARPNVAGAPASPWVDALHELCLAEQTLSKLETSVVFQSFTATQKAQYYQVLGEMQILIRELSSETSQQKAS